MAYINPQNQLFPILNVGLDASEIGMAIPPYLTYNERVNYYLNNLTLYLEDIQKPKKKLSRRLPILIDNLKHHTDKDVIEFYRYVPDTWIDRTDLLTQIRNHVIFNL